MLEQYCNENSRRTRLGLPAQRKRNRWADEPKQGDPVEEHDVNGDGVDDPMRESAISSEDDAEQLREIRIIRLLYQGNIKLVDQASEIARKTKVGMGKT